jgi:hypothetical protein
LSGVHSKFLQIHTFSDPVHKIMFGAIPTTDDAVVLVRNPVAVSSYSRVDVIVFSQRNGQVVREMKPIGDLKCVLDPRTCGMAIRKGADGTFVLTCRPDGLLERKMIAH